MCHFKGWTDTYQFQKLLSIILGLITVAIHVIHMLDPNSFVIYDAVYFSQAACSWFEDRSMWHVGFIIW